MAIPYIPPSQPDPNHKGVVYKDDPLEREVVVAYRRAATKDQSGGPIVLDAEEPKQILGIVQYLQVIKAGASATLKGHAKLAFDAFVDQLSKAGYVDSGTKNLEPLQRRLKANAKLEIVCQPNQAEKNHYAVMSMSSDGLAYVDSKGNALPNEEIEMGNNQKTPLSQALKSFWYLLYHERPADNDSSAQQAAQAKFNSSCHFHTGVDQQAAADHHSSAGWAAANLAALHDNVKQQTADLKKLHKIAHRTLLTSANRQDQFKDEQRCEQQFNQRGGDVDELNQRVTALHEDAAAVRDDPVQQRQNTASFFYQSEKGASNGSELSAHVTIHLKPLPKFKLDESDFNQLTSERENGVVHHFTIEQDGAVAAKSSGGEVTYRERFEQLARDLLVTYTEKILENDKEVYRLKDKIIIDQIDPPEQEQLCREVFEDVFGAVNVEFECEANAVEFEPVSAGNIAATGN